jgi:predicted nuclease of restriction endonuclease-like (RecB) superfamily
MTKRTTRKHSSPARRKPADTAQPSDYSKVLGDIKRLIADSRRRALSTVNRELVLVYWQIGAVIVHQQESAEWGDGVVEQLAADLRAEFPDMKGFTKDNLFRMRKFALSCLEIDEWVSSGVRSVEVLSKGESSSEFVRKNEQTEKVGTLSPQFLNAAASYVGTMCPQIRSSELARRLVALSWSHHRSIVACSDSPAERYFYIKMAVRERWSVRELRRQLDSCLFTRYVSVREEPEKCLPDDAESGALLPFKDSYVLEFLGLEEEYSERELRHSILANLRDFFLEFGKELTFVGEEYPVTVGGETFHIDLLFFHRRLQCLIVIELKKGKFNPEYVGKSRFYCAALDEFIKLPHENPTLGLVLCRSADAVQVRLALTDAAEKIGIATYQTALPDERVIRQRIEQLPELPAPEFSEENE